MRMNKSISFTDEYHNEYIKFCKEGNASLLVCELLRSHYKEDYNLKDINKDLTYVKEMLRDIMQLLEVGKYE